MARPGGKDRGLYERPVGSGIWWIQYSDVDGRKRREKGGTKSQARELYAFRKAAVHRRRKGFEPDPREQRQVPTLKKAWEDYRDERDTSLRRPDHDRLYQRYWTDLYGNLRLNELKADELHRWRSRRLKEVKPSTVNRALTYLQAIYSLAIRDGLVEVNPVSRVGKLDEQKRNRVLSEAEEKLLRGALPWERFRAIELAVHTGLRRGEQFGGRRKEIDLRNRTWRIPQTKDGPERWVPLNERAHAILTEMLAEHDSEWLYPAPRREGHQDPAAWARRHLEDPCRRLGIADLNWHDLRHTCATRMLEREVPLSFVQEILGHQSYKTTERYKHLAARHLREALQTLVFAPDGHQNGHQDGHLAETSLTLATSAPGS